MKKNWKFIVKNIYIKNLLLAALIVVVLVTIVLWCLSIYTQHGKAVDVPDVKGLQVEQASSFFEKNKLRYEVIDSAFIKNAAPGSIVEITPKPGTKVKEGRIIFLTINAFSVQTFILPSVRDLSQRQALAMLHAIGFGNINVEYVPGEYRDLVVGLRYKGREVVAGEKLPVNSRLTLEVSSGSGPVLSDSVIIEGTPEESWF